MITNAGALYRRYVFLFFLRKRIVISLNFRLRSLNYEINKIIVDIFQNSINETKKKKLEKIILNAQQKRI